MDRCMQEVSDVRGNRFRSAQFVRRSEVAKQRCKLFVYSKRLDWVTQKIGKKGIHFVRSQLINLAKDHILAQLLHKFRSSIQRSEEHTSELQSLMRISYAVFCLKKKITHKHIT